MPGKVENHHASRRYLRPSAIITPQSGVGGWVPRPMKPSAAVVSTAKPMSIDALTRIVGKALGRMWREEDAAAAGPDRLRGFRELGFAQGNDVRPRQPAVARPPDERDGDHHVEKPGTERGGERHGQDQVGDGEEDVGDAHDHLAEPAAEESGDAPSKVPTVKARTMTTKPATSETRAPTITRVKTSRPT